MRPAPEVHDALACLLTYPGRDGAATGYEAAVELVSRACPETAPDLATFFDGILGVKPSQLEELYTRTFDNVAERSLEIGWQLFGENYARGVLMVRFRGLMREYGVPETSELPDHLTHVLATMARIPEEVSSALASNQVNLALQKMVEGLRHYDSPWTGVLEATVKVVHMHQSETKLSPEATR